MAIFRDEYSYRRLQTTKPRYTTPKAIIVFVQQEPKESMGTSWFGLLQRHDPSAPDDRDIHPHQRTLPERRYGDIAVHIQR